MEEINRFLDLLKKLEKETIEKDKFYNSHIMMDAITNKECYPSFDEFMDWLDELDFQPKTDQRFILINIQKMFRDAKMPNRALLTNYKLNSI